MGGIQNVSQNQTQPEVGVVDSKEPEKGGRNAKWTIGNPFRSTSGIRSGMSMDDLKKATKERERQKQMNEMRVGQNFFTKPFQKRWHRCQQGGGGGGSQYPPNHDPNGNAINRMGSGSEEEEQSFSFTSDYSPMTDMSPPSFSNYYPPPTSTSSSSNTSSPPTTPDPSGLPRQRGGVVVHPYILPSYYPNNNNNPNQQMIQPTLSLSSNNTTYPMEPSNQLPPTYPTILKPSPLQSLDSTPLSSPLPSPTLKPHPTPPLQPTMKELFLPPQSIIPPTLDRSNFQQQFSYSTSTPPSPILQSPPQHQFNYHHPIQEQESEQEQEGVENVLQSISESLSELGSLPVNSSSSFMSSPNSNSMNIRTPANKMRDDFFPFPLNDDHDQDQENDVPIIKTNNKPTITASDLPPLLIQNTLSHEVVGDSSSESFHQFLLDSSSSSISPTSTVGSTTPSNKDVSPHNTIIPLTPPQNLSSSSAGSNPSTSTTIQDLFTYSTSPPSLDGFTKKSGGVGKDNHLYFSSEIPTSSTTTSTSSSSTTTFTSNSSSPKSNSDDTKRRRRMGDGDENDGKSSPPQKKKFEVEDLISVVPKIEIPETKTTTTKKIKKKKKKWKQTKDKGEKSNKEDENDEGNLKEKESISPSPKSKKNNNNKDDESKKKKKNKSNKQQHIRKASSPRYIQFPELILEVEEEDGDELQFSSTIRGRNQPTNQDQVRRNSSSPTSNNNLLRESIGSNESSSNSSEKSISSSSINSTSPKSLDSPSHILIQEMTNKGIYIFNHVFDLHVLLID